MCPCLQAAEATNDTPASLSVNCHLHGDDEQSFSRGHAKLFNSHTLLNHGQELMILFLHIINS